MNKLRCLLLLISAVTAMLVCGACSSGPDNELAALVDVPGTALLPVVNAIKMPAELSTAADTLLAQSDYQLPLDYVLASQDVNERRAMLYLMCALYSNLVLNDIAVFTPVCDAGLYADNIDDLADDAGAAIELAVEDDATDDCYILSWDADLTPQELADIGDEWLTDPSGAVWYVEPSTYSELTSL